MTYSYNSVAIPLGLQYYDTYDGKTYVLAPAFDCFTGPGCPRYAWHLYIVDNATMNVVHNIDVTSYVHSDFGIFAIGAGISVDSDGVYLFDGGWLTKLSPDGGTKLWGSMAMPDFWPYYQYHVTCSMVSRSSGGDIYVVCKGTNGFGYEASWLFKYASANGILLRSNLFSLDTKSSGFMRSLLFLPT